MSTHIEINGRVLTGWQKAFATPFVWLFGLYLSLIAMLVSLALTLAMTVPIWGPILFLVWLAR
jgi:hypothetical protein